MMKTYKALVTFAGEASMVIGEVRELNSSLAEPLVKCGYVEVIENESKPDKSRGNTESSSRTTGKS